MSPAPVNLLMLPGMDGTGRLFDPLLAELPAWIRPRVVAYPIHEAASLGRLAAEAARQIPDGGAVVLAESFSGLVALRMLADGAAGVRGLIFVAAFGVPPRPQLSSLVVRVPSVARLASRVPGFVLRWLGLGKDAPAALVDAVRAAVSAPDPHVLAHRAAMIGRDQGFGSLRMQEVPCRYLQATDDRLVPASAVAFFRDRFVDFRSVRVKGPHFVLQANPRGAAAAISEACAGLNAIPTQPVRPAGTACWRSSSCGPVVRKQSSSPLEGDGFDPSQAHSAWLVPLRRCACRAHVETRA